MQDWLSKLPRWALHILAGVALGLLGWLVKDSYDTLRGVEDWSIRHEAESKAKFDQLQEGLGSVGRIVPEITRVLETQGRLLERIDERSRMLLRENDIRDRRKRDDG